MELFKTIKLYTGHKSKPQMNGALFTSENKAQCIAGNQNIADALANKFKSNHELTT